MKNITPAIKAVDLNYSLNGKEILENLNFDISSGEYVALIGPNGAGKTTLVKIILGLIRPDSGTIRIFGMNITDAKKKIKTGYVPQKLSTPDSVFPSTVTEVVESGRYGNFSFFRKISKEDKKIIDEVVEVTMIGELMEKTLDALSGGELQRVYIARALVQEPKILILDEPTVGVDILKQKKFYNFLKKINKEMGITIIMVTHDIDIVTREAVHVLCLNKKLFCHTTSRNFSKGSMLSKLYGEDMKKVVHK